MWVPSKLLVDPVALHSLWCHPRCAQESLQNQYAPKGQRLARAMRTAFVAGNYEQVDILADQLIVLSVERKELSFWPEDIE